MKERTNQHDRDDARAVLRPRSLILGAMILLAAGGVVALSMTGRAREVPNIPPAAAVTTPLGSSAPSNAAAPRPWQYDPAKDRHWDPTHGHWHPGRPPAQPPPILSTPEQPPPGQPWEYNAATNQHWDPRPGHQHWHSGPPPPPDQRP